MMWTRIESSVWLTSYLCRSVGIAHAQTATVNQKIEAKVIADLGQNDRSNSVE